MIARRPITVMRRTTCRTTTRTRRFTTPHRSTSESACSPTPITGAGRIMATVTAMPPTGRSTVTAVAGRITATADIGAGLTGPVVTGVVTTMTTTAAAIGAMAAAMATAIGATVVVAMADTVVVMPIRTLAPAVPVALGVADATDTAINRSVRAPAISHAPVLRRERTSPMRALRPTIATRLQAHRQARRQARGERSP